MHCKITREEKSRGEKYEREKTETEKQLKCQLKKQSIASFLLIFNVIFLWTYCTCWLDCLKQIKPLKVITVVVLMSLVNKRGSDHYFWFTHVVKDNPVSDKEGTWRIPCNLLGLESPFRKLLSGVSFLPTWCRGIRQCPFFYFSNKPGRGIFGS